MNAHRDVERLERDIEHLRLIAAAFVHPVQLRIIDLMRDAGSQRWSPKRLAVELGDVPLENVSYHVRAPAEKRVLVPDGHEVKRGAVEHLYVLAPGLR